MQDKRRIVFLSDDVDGGVSPYFVGTYVGDLQQLFQRLLRTIHLASHARAIAMEALKESFSEEDYQNYIDYLESSCGEANRSAILDLLCPERLASFSQIAEDYFLQQLPNELEVAITGLRARAMEYGLKILTEADGQLYQPDDSAKAFIDNDANHIEAFKRVDLGALLEASESIFHLCKKVKSFHDTSKKEYFKSRNRGNGEDWQSAWGKLSREMYADEELCLRNRDLIACLDTFANPDCPSAKTIMKQFLAKTHGWSDGYLDKVLSQARKETKQKNIPQESEFEKPDISTP
jgi:hypothetical protein